MLGAMEPTMPRLVVHVFVALMVAAVLLLPPVANAATHINSAEAGHHFTMADDHHGHGSAIEAAAEDDVDSHDWARQHGHKHKIGDHSHELPDCVRMSSSAWSPFRLSWPLQSQIEISSDRRIGFERPPKLLES